MDEMLKCPHCQSLSQDEGYNFCPNCKGQVRCLNLECKSIIKTVAEICLFCGTEVKKAQKTEVNTFELVEDYSETSSSRKIIITATDNAVDKFAGTFFHLTQQNGQNKRSQNLFQPSINRVSENALQGSKQEKVVNVESFAAQPEINETNVELITEIDENTKTQIGQNLFKLNQDSTLVVLKLLRDKKYGDSTDSARWKARNLVLFFIVAYEFYNQKLPNKDQIYAIIREEKLYDSNFRDDFTRFIAKQYLTARGENCYELHHSGQQQLLNAISTLTNPSEEPQSVRKKARTSGRTKGSQSKKDLETIENWIKNDFDTSTFDVRSLKTARNWALFILYILKYKLKVAESVKPGLIFLYATTKFSEMSVNKRTFANIFGSEKTLFDQNNTGAYFLTQEGQKVAESLISGKI